MGGVAHHHVLHAAWLVQAGHRNLRGRAWGSRATGSMAAVSHIPASAGSGHLLPCSSSEGAPGEGVVPSGLSFAWVERRAAGKSDLERPRAGIGRQGGIMGLF